MNSRSELSGKLSLLAVVLVISIILLVRVNKPPRNNLRFDVFGYYLYLPAAFIYNDLGLKDKSVIEKMMEKYGSSPTFYQVTKSPTDNWIMKYSMGMAVLYAPAFLTGHAIAMAHPDYPADGFSKPYQRALMYYNFLFTLLGLLVLRKVLLRFFTDTTTAWVLLLIFFGTNYFTNAVYNPEMPHNYLFSLYALILWFTIRWHEDFKMKYALGLGISIGLATLARPSELVALFIPLLWNTTGFKDLKNKVVQFWPLYRVQLFAFAGILLLIGSAQFIYWFIYSGRLIYSGYRNPGEGFDFLSPYTLKFLFSFRKGWLIYTPMMIATLVGFYFMWKQNRLVFFSVFVFFVVNLYIVSSWSNWWYAQSFGQRAMVQSYAVLSIPLGYALLAIGRLARVKRLVVYGILLFLVALNLFQTWQARYEIISRDRMTFAHYLKSFGSLEKDPDIANLLLIDRTGGGAKTLPPNRKYSGKVLYQNDFESGGSTPTSQLTDTIYRSGYHALRMDKNVRYAGKFTMPFEEITDHYYAWIRVSVWVYPVHDIQETPARIAISFQHKGGNYKSRFYRIEEADKEQKLVPNVWNKISYDYLSPEIRSKKDLLLVFLWNLGDKEIFFDDLTIEAFEEQLVK